MRYFVTPSNPNVFLIGIYENQLYGFGKKNEKLCLYQKSIFDNCDWEEFFVAEINVMKAECCENGLHVASGIRGTEIFIATRDKEFTHVFSVDILTKEFTELKMLEKLYDGFATPYLNLCCKCLSPVLRFLGYDDDMNLYSFMITPRCYNKDVGIYRILVYFNKSLYCLLQMDSNSYKLDSVISSNIAVNRQGEAFSIVEKENGRLKSIGLGASWIETVLNIPEDLVWHDMAFFHDDKFTFSLSRQKRDDDILLQLSYLKFSVSNRYLTSSLDTTFTVDSNFPSFESVPFFFSYKKVGVKISSLKKRLIGVQPHFIVFQTTSNSIVTIPLRMLSLSESAYLSLRQIPEPSLPPAVPEFMIIEQILNFINYLIGRKSKKTVDDRWMSLNFIKKTLGLSKNFALK
uniref:Uncharacterized protein n=1 Tax=Panagrolaimus davidi TaxID=227884 RepID=A0A914PA63_9BILA